MNEINTISITQSKGRSARCGKSGQSSRSSASEVRQLQAELAHVRSELQTLKRATEQFVRQLL